MIIFAIAILIFGFSMYPWMTTAILIAGLIQELINNGWKWKDFKNLPKDTYDMIHSMLKNK